ncbi:MAG: nitrilase-related carbon-nitrogen hydrolase [Candidatus Kapaibacteriales bacterium]
MNVAIVQFKPNFKQLESNLEFLKDKSENIAADLICFPEMATSGYFFLSKDEIWPFVFDFKSEIIRTFQDISTKHSRIIIFGFPERSGNTIYNSAAIIFPDPQLTCVYRKTHLFYKEKLIFEAGDTGYFVNFYEPLNLKLGVLLCYDWRFPEASRSLGILGADLIACPSNLVTKVWTIAIPARALENHLYFLVSNRVGFEQNNNEKVEFNGKSGLWDYNGEVMALASSTDEQVLICQIDPTKARNKKINDYNEIFADRRPEMYINSL